jgi:hypothetical protein
MSLQGPYPNTKSPIEFRNRALQPRHEFLLEALGAMVPGLGFDVMHPISVAPDQR